jgi:outer membrane protein assembly factor BamB
MRSRREVLGLGALLGTGLGGCLGTAEQEPDAATATPADNGADGSATSSATGTPSLPTRPDAIFRADIERTGYHPDATVPDAVEAAWSVPGINKGDHTAAKASPLVYDGSVVTPGDVGTVFSYTPDGDLEWATALHPSGFGTHATPVIVDGTIYTTGYDGAVYAIDAADGSMQWRTVVADAIGSSPAYYDGTLYIATEFYDPSGGMSALDPVTGEEVWRDERVTNHAHSITGIDPEAGVFAAGSNDGKLYVWNLDDRSFRGSVDTGGPIKGPICMYDGLAIFGSWSNFVYGVDLERVDVAWQYAAADDVMSGAGLHPDSETVYIGSHDRHCHAIDATTGEPRWRTHLGGWITGSPVVTDDTVLVGSYDTTLFALTHDGDVRWRFTDPDGWVTSTPAIHDGDIYVTGRATNNTTGRLYKLVGN